MRVEMVFFFQLIIVPSSTVSSLSVSIRSMISSSYIKYVPPFVCWITGGVMIVDVIPHPMMI